MAPSVCYAFLKMFTRKFDTIFALSPDPQRTGSFYDQRLVIELDTRYVNVGFTLANKKDQKKKK